MRRPHRLNKMPSDIQKKMEIIGNGALRIYREWKAGQAELDIVEAEKTPARMTKRANRAVKQIATRLGTATITVLTKKNPYREGTKVHAQFEVLLRCRTVGKALHQGKELGLTGLTNWKLQWFEKQKTIKIG